MMTENASPKPRLELAQESQETLSVLDLDRTPREEKLRRESAYLAGADEVSYSERAFRPHHPATLDEIREEVDALQVKRVLPAEAPVAPAPELPEEPAVAPVSVPDHYRAPLEAAIEGALVSVETVHRVGTGTVVEVAWEDRTGALRRGLYLVKGREAVPYESLAARIDELPAPKRSVEPSSVDAPPALDAPQPQAAPQVASEPVAVAKPEEPAKKGLRARFGRGDKKEAEPAPGPAPEAEKAGLTGRLGFGKRKVAEKPTEAPSPETASEEPAEKAGKKRFGFGRK